MAPKPSPRTRLAAWVLYDWANSAFTTVVVTFIYSTWFTQNMAGDPVQGTAYWSRAMSSSALLVAVLSPLIGAMADRSGGRRGYLLGSTLLCVFATAALAFIAPSRPHAALLALSVFVVANVAFEIAGMLYNSYLPDIAAPERIGTVSGLGWGVGYLAGILSLLLALLAFVGFGEARPWLDLPVAEGFHLRAVNLMVALWFLIFAVPIFVFVRDEARRHEKAGAADAFRELRQTFRKMGRYREMAKFLIARLVYNDGLITIFAFGGIYAVGTFGMSMSEVILFGVVLNVAAGLGAFLFGFVDDRLGGKRTVMISLVALSVACGLAVWAPTRTWFWVAGIMVGVFAGPNQAASRSLMGRFVPRNREAEFFGFFAFSGKLTSFAGPLLLGWTAARFASQRAGIASILLFLITGAILLARVDEREGCLAAQELDG